MAAMSKAEESVLAELEAIAASGPSGPFLDRLIELFGKLDWQGLMLKILTVILAKWGIVLEKKSDSGGLIA